MKELYVVYVGGCGVRGCRTLGGCVFRGVSKFRGVMRSCR